MSHSLQGGDNEPALQTFHRQSLERIQKLRAATDQAEALATACSKPQTRSNGKPLLSLDEAERLAEIAATAPSQHHGSATAFCVALQAELAPHTCFNQAVTAITQSVQQLQQHGLAVREIAIDPRGLGNALVDVLRSNPALGEAVVPKPLR